MTKILFIFFLLISQISFGQDIAELERRNGFKDIKLGMPIDSVKGAEFRKEVKEKNEFPAKLYEIDNDEYKNVLNNCLA